MVVCLLAGLDGAVPLLGVVVLRARRVCVARVVVVPAAGEDERAPGVIPFWLVEPDVMAPGMVDPGVVDPGVAEPGVGEGVIDPGAVLAEPGGEICWPDVALGEAAAAPTGPVAPPASGAAPVWAKAGAERARAATAASREVFMRL